jgi:hypothetical protein
MLYVETCNLYLLHESCLTGRNMDYLYGQDHAFSLRKKQRNIWHMYMYGFYSV